MSIDFKAGDTYPIRDALSGPPHYKIHILSVIDDNYIVFKWYGKFKQWWHYDILDAELLEIKINRAIKLAPSVEQ